MGTIYFGTAVRVLTYSCRPPRPSAGIPTPLQGELSCFGAAVEGLLLLASEKQVCFT